MPRTLARGGHRTRCGQRGGATATTGSPEACAVDDAGAVVVPAPLSRIPVWVRRGALIVTYPAEHVARGLGDTPEHSRPLEATLWGTPPCGRAVARLADGTVIRWTRGEWSVSGSARTRRVPRARTMKTRAPRPLQVRVESTYANGLFTTSARWRTILATWRSPPLSHFGPHAPAAPGGRGSELLDGSKTTIHVAAYDTERTEVRVAVLRGQARLEPWCAARGDEEALVGGFFVRPDGTPLGEVRTRGVARRHVPFAAPWASVRACVHVAGRRHVDRARATSLPAEPRGDLLQAGPLLVRDGAPVFRRDGGPRGLQRRRGAVRLRHHRRPLPARGAGAGAGAGVRGRVRRALAP